MKEKELNLAANYLVTMLGSMPSRYLPETTTKDIAELRKALHESNGRVWERSATLLDDIFRLQNCSGAMPFRIVTAITNLQAAMSAYEQQFATA